MSRRKRSAKQQLAQQKARAGLHAAASANDRRASLASLAAESDRHFEDLIARRLALPVEKRMNFLRRRLPGGGSCM
jgi:hypothetical protein